MSPTRIKWVVIIALALVIAPDAHAEVLDKFDGCHVHRIQVSQLVLMAVGLVGLTISQVRKLAVVLLIIAGALPLLSPALLEPIWPFSSDQVQYALLNEMKNCTAYRRLSPRQQILGLSCVAFLVTYLSVRNVRRTTGSES